MMQNNVADTLALACVGLLEDCRNRGLHARPLAALYDALLTLCPIEEKDLVAELHHEWLHVRTFWNVPNNRILRYTIESDFCTRWSTKTTKEEAQLLGKPPKFKELDRAA